MIRVRHARKSDYKQIVAIHNSWIDIPNQDPHTGFLFGRQDEYYEYSLASTYVATQGREILGYCSFTETPPTIFGRRLAVIAKAKNKPGPNTTYIINIAIKKSRLKEGIGTMIYQGLPGARLWANVATRPIPNQASHKFHQRLGFKKLETVRMPTGSWALYALERPRP